MSTWVIARLTFHEARRSRVLLAALLLSLVFLAVYGLGFNYIHAEMAHQSTLGALGMSEFTNFLLMAGLYVVNFLTAMMAVLTSVGTLSGEIASGTIQTLVSKPLQRWEIVLGKWLGYVGMLSLYLVLLAGGVLVVVYQVSGYTPPNVERGLGLLWLNAAMLLSLSFLGSAWLSTLTNGVLVFGLFGIAFVGGWIEQIGSMIQNQTAVQVGILSSLLMPSEALWRRMAFEVQSPLVSALGGVSPFTAASIPSPMMVDYAVFYSLAALLGALLVFRRRDL